MFRLTFIQILITNNETQYSKPLTYTNESHINYKYLRMYNVCLQDACIRLKHN